MFDPRIPYHRRMWHYDSDRQLSVAQLIALGSVDARTAALLWLLIQRHHSLIVSGPTDPTPGIGKTTTLNALLGFLPPGTTLVYTAGMYEDFDFKSMVEPETTCVLANEVSDHLRIYMWSDVARELLELPKDGYAIATSCHADTVQDVLSMLRHDLRTPADTVRGLGIVINIGIVGRVWPPRRRFLTVNFIAPQAPDGAPNDIRLIPLAEWQAATDTFTPASDAALAEIATITGMPLADFCAAIERRQRRLEELSDGRGLGPSRMREAVDALIASEQNSEQAEDTEDDDIKDDDAASSAP
ncbi:MAG TPA: hypothetical protein VFU63_04140 [Ktedonobacterales bacterium]|nr:hypothetical protein [Ktedonobacterales bacterium]